MHGVHLIEAGEGSVASAADASQVPPLSPGIVELIACDDGENGPRYTEDFIVSAARLACPYPVDEQGLVDPDKEALWQDHMRYFINEDPEALKRLVERYYPLAAWFVRRKLNVTSAYDSPEDLDQIAGLEMMRTLKRFDPFRGVVFGTFLGSTLTGFFKKYARDGDRIIRTPRRYFEAYPEVRNVRGALSSKLGRMVTDGEVAAEMDVETAFVQETEQAHQARTPDSLDCVYEDGGALEVMDGAGRPVSDVAVDRTLIMEAMRGLSEREKTIIYLRFFENQSQTEIAKVVGVSQAHVGRLIKQALGSMRITLQTSPTHEASEEILEAVG